ncbi:MAG: LysR family transcriptional regulator [Planctomycetes bacterium]|nr:LysR family transcriptional regulator [Planctomycetota bacterium]
MLNVHQLNVFVTAADTLNFTQTAKRLHLTQSSVSQHIKSLEGQLDVSLFVRKGRTLEVTDEGRVLLPMARDLVDGSIRATERMESIKKEIHGHLIIGCNTATGKYILPTLLAGFSEVYPQVRFTCQVLPQDLTLKRLAEGDIHFAFTNASHVNEGTAEFQLYFQEPVVLIASPSHPWSERESIAPGELTDERFIMREPRSGTYSNVRLGLNELGVDIEKLNVLVEMGTSEAIALAVQQELGVGFVSRMIVDKICHDKVCTVTVQGLNVHQKIYFGRQIVQPVTGAQVAFWNHIRSMDTSIFECSE